MQKIYYKRKFTQFLKEHNLYDENAMKYLYQNGIFFDYIEEEKCSSVGGAGFHERK